MKKNLIFFILIALCSCGGGEIKQVPKHLTVGVDDMISGNEMYQKACYKNALEKYFSALKKFTIADQVIESAKALNNIGNIYRLMGKKDDSILFFNDAKTLYTSQKNYQGIIQTKSNLGAVYISKGEYKKAEELLLDAEKEMGQRKIYIPSVLRNIAILYIKTGKLDLSGKYFSKIENRNDKKKIFSSSFYYARGNYFSLIKKHGKAVENFKLALSIDRKTGYFEAVAQDLHALGTTYAKIKDIDKSALYLKRSLRIYSILGNKEKAATVLNELNLLKPEISPLESFFVNKWLKMEESHCD